MSQLSITWSTCCPCAAPSHWRSCVVTCQITTKLGESYEGWNVRFPKLHGSWDRTRNNFRTSSERKNIGSREFLGFECAHQKRSLWHKLLQVAQFVRECSLHGDHVFNWLVQIWCLFARCWKHSSTDLQNVTQFDGRLLLHAVTEWNEYQGSISIKVPRNSNPMDTESPWEFNLPTVNFWTLNTVSLPCRLCGNFGLNFCCFAHWLGFWGAHLMKKSDQKTVAQGYTAKHVPWQMWVWIQMSLLYWQNVHFLSCVARKYGNLHTSIFFRLVNSSSIIFIAFSIKGFLALLLSAILTILLRKVNNDKAKTGKGPFPKQGQWVRSNWLNSNANCATLPCFFVCVHADRTALHFWLWCTGYLLHICNSLSR